MDNVILDSNKCKLNPDEAAVLTGLANGNDVFDLCQQLGMSGAEMNTIERDIRAKLNANTTPHMISRAWQLGVLITRVLCLALVMITSVNTIDPDMSRVRNSNNNNRNNSNVMARVRLAGRNKTLDA